MENSITSIEKLIAWLQVNNPHGDFLPYHDFSTQSIIVLDCDITKMNLPNGFYMNQPNNRLVELTNRHNVQADFTVSALIYEYRNVKRDLASGEEIS